MMFTTFSYFAFSCLVFPWKMPKREGVISGATDTVQFQDENKSHDCAVGRDFYPSFLQWDCGLHCVTPGTPEMTCC